MVLGKLYPVILRQTLNLIGACLVTVTEYSETCFLTKTHLTNFYREKGVFFFKNLF